MPDHENFRVEATEFLDTGNDVVVIGRRCAWKGALSSSRSRFAQRSSRLPLWRTPNGLEGVRPKSRSSPRCAIGTEGG